MAHDETIVGIEGFQRAVQAVLEEFKTATEADLAKAVDDTAKEVRKRTASASPRQKGEYKKGWKTRVTGRGIGNYQRTVYNGPHGRRTHLLQNGHVSRNQFGGPYGRVSARPHITPDAETERLFVQKFKALMGR